MTTKSSDIGQQPPSAIDTEPPPEVADPEAQIRLAHFTELFDFAPLGYFRLNADGGVCKANLAAARLLGVERAQLVGAPFESFLDEASRPAFHDFMGDIFASVLPQSTEVRLRDSGTGARIVVLTGAVPPGSRQCLVATVDVTEQHRMAEQVRAADQRYRRIVETTSEGVLITDATAHVAFANERFAAMLGYSTQEILGRSAFEFLESEDHEVGVQHLEQRRRGIAASYEIRLRNKAGGHVWVQVSSNALRDAQGVYEGTVALLSDVTARRHAETQLQEVQQQLLQSQKMEAIGSLAAGVAHDFNNLLSVILGYAGLLLYDCPTESPARAELLQIVSAAERGGALTRQLLAFSRKQVLKPQSVDLNQRVRALDAMLSRVLGPQLRVSFVGAPGLGQIRADPGQVDQVILNLAVNARDAMPSGGDLSFATSDVELDAAYAAQHPDVVPGAYVMLSVKDTGTGIDPALLPRIFEPFFTTKEASRGTGLGLSTVYGVVKQSGGHIDLTSRVGEGTTFRVYFPRAEAGPALAPAPVRAPLSMRGTETILLVEDEDAVRAAMAAVLRRHGYQVHEAARPGDALLLFERHAAAIQLLLTDIAMPLMNGVDLAERLVPMRPGLKVLHVSGQPSHGRLDEACLDDLGCAYLQKPFTPDALATAVRALLDGPQGTGGPRAA